MFAAAIPPGRLTANPLHPRCQKVVPHTVACLLKSWLKNRSLSADREGLKSRACTQDFLSFLICAFFFLAPVWRRLGLLLAKDNLAFFCGSAECGDLPETPFLGSSF